MENVAGSLGAAPIWKALMEKYLEGKPSENFEKPKGIVLTFCRGKDASSSAKAEYFIKGTESKINCLSEKLILTPTSTP